MEHMDIERTKQMVQRMMELGEMIQPGSMKEFNDRNPNFSPMNSIKFCMIP